MMQYVDDDEFLEIAVSQFCSKYSQAELQDAIDGFEWRDTTEASLAKRREISEQYRQWAREGAAIDTAEVMATEVYKWGFGKNNCPNSLKSNWPLFCRVNQCWNEGSDRKQMVELLSELLCLKGIGIATASKWICFIDGDRYAIYDSRVSAALMSIKVNNKRVFPTVGRRQFGAKKYPAPTFRTPAQMASDYLFFTDFASVVAKRYDLGIPARVEMGLFMLGNIEDNWV